MTPCPTNAGVTLTNARLTKRSDRVPLRFWVCACAALLSTPVARAQDAAEDRFVVTMVDGPSLTGRLVDVADDGRTVVFEVEETTRSVPVEELVALRRFVSPDASRDAKLSGPLPPSGPFFVLAGGDRVDGTLAKATEDAVSVASPVFGTMDIPLEVVRLAVLLAPDDPAACHRMLERLAAHQQPNDLVLLDNGDTFLGTLLRIDGAHLTLETSSGEIAIARETVAALAMNPELVAAPVLEGLHAIIQLADGSRVTVRLPQLTEGRLEFATAFRAPLTVEPSRLLSLQILGGQVQYLSDLEPVAYRHTPYLSLRWPWMRDRSVGGRPLLLGGRRHAKGLGVHSRCELTYELAGRFRRFEATIGIDDETDGKGSAVFRVLVDEQERFASPVLRGTDAPIDLAPIDVSDAARLTLIVDFADHGDVQDHADWADARLVK